MKIADTRNTQPKNTAQNVNTKMVGIPAKRHLLYVSLMEHRGDSTILVLTQYPLLRVGNS